MEITCFGNAIRFNDGVTVCFDAHGNAHVASPATNTNEWLLPHDSAGNVERDSADYPHHIAEAQAAQAQHEADVAATRAYFWQRAVANNVRTATDRAVYYAVCAALAAIPVSRTPTPTKRALEALINWDSASPCLVGHEPCGHRGCP